MIRLKLNAEDVVAYSILTVNRRRRVYFGKIQTQNRY